MIYLLHQLGVDITVITITQNMAIEPECDKEEFDIPQILFAPPP